MLGEASAPLTNRELANRLSVDPGHLHFHVRMLHRAGLIELAETGGKPMVPATMLMTQGTMGRWQTRLRNLVEIAGLVAPFVEGGALATFATIGGALDARHGAVLGASAVLQGRRETPET